MNHLKKKKTGRKKGKKDSKRLDGFPIDPAENYTPTEIASWMRLLSKEPILKAIKLGLLPASKIGRGYIIQGSNAIKFLQSKRVYKNIKD